MDKRVEESKPLTTQPSMTLRGLYERFPDEDGCKAYIRDARWPNGVRCPRCGNDKVYALKQPWKWQCQNPDCNPEKKGKNRGYRFSITTGTVFENTKYPLRTWFEVGYLMCQSKKGVSALQIHRQIRSGDYRTAWFICHRLRAAMQNAEFEQLLGEVEIDETFLGGKTKNKQERTRQPAWRPWAFDRSHWRDLPQGQYRLQNDRGVRFQHTYNDFVREAVSSKVSFPHDTVSHKSEEYVRRE